ncbi:hypothetical protein P4646_09545 [Peribacillus simplex]|uniref:hypothetical protein n=1 Tax=Peribacillus simplex TaxID=1478 RepID=UPI002E1CC3AE|nr:hypothetical protein [Peribacillus simplex]MED4097071.1 hypothetical protein [Peribacillus simplex]
MNIKVKHPSIIDLLFPNQVNKKKDIQIDALKYKINKKVLFYAFGGDEECHTRLI